MKRDILHVDMNNFYASVECMLNPSLRPYPVAVCGSTAERHGIVLAKNYLAKGFGVQTGEVIWQARQKCPDLVVVEPHYDEYLKYSRLARSIYARYTNQVEPYGMDECWLDISGTTHQKTAYDIADEIRRTITFELGLTVSVGVSFCKVFAKLGSDLKKPDAITEIPQETYLEKVGHLPASDLLGVGRSTAKVLRSAGILTIRDLAEIRPEWMQKKLGKNGLKLWYWANGHDDSPVAPMNYSSPVKSVGHGITTVKDLENDREVWMVLLDLAQDVGHRLRTHQKKACGVIVRIRDCKLGSRQYQVPLPYPTQSPYLLAAAAYELFTRQYSWSVPIRSVTICAINLLGQDEPVQCSLFHSIRSVEKQEKLDAAVEDIRRRFGSHAICNAVLLTGSFQPPEKPAITMPTGLF